MIDQHQSEDVGENNESSLQMLVGAIELEEFSLIFARCNYASLRDRMVERLKEICPVDIRAIALKESATTLYTTIKNELDDAKPAALMVFDIELVSALDQVLISANQVREEFRKNFPFPVVLWLNDEVLNNLTYSAPDLKSWGIFCEFAMATDDLVALLQQNEDCIFSQILEAGDQFLPNSDLLGSRYRLEIASACHDLQNRGCKLQPELEASLQFIRGRDEYANDRLDTALTLYRQSLEFWRQRHHLERQGTLLFHIGLCYCRKADLQRSEDRRYWQGARNYFQQCLGVFEQAQRSDLVAQFINQLGKVLQRLEAWKKLWDLTDKALRLHRTSGTPVQLAQDYGFLAEVALRAKRADKVSQFAQQALQILAQAPTNPQQSLSLLILAQAQRELNQPAAAITNLEKAITSFPQADPRLYIRILTELRSLYFEQKQYLKAFEIKQEQRLIEQQYGFKAFIGASRLRLLGHGSRQEETVFGRQQDIERLINEGICSQTRKLTVIHGPSGVGKSSLIDAGLVPVLKQKNIGERRVLPIVLRVYTDWIGALGKALAEAVKEIRGIELPAPTSLAEIIEQFQKNSQRHLLTVLIFDQFEEFFFVESKQNQKQQFYNFLKDCLTGKDIQYVRVLISLREDYLHCLLEYERFINLNKFDINIDILSKESRYYIGNFSQDAAKSVIVNLTKHSQLYLNDELINQLVQDLAVKEGEVRPIELQIVGAQLQEDNITTLEEYRRLGDNPKAELVERYLARVIEDCGAENKQIAQLILYLLTDENNTRPLKTREELVESLELKANNLDFILQILVGSGLVIRVPESPK